MRTKILFRRVIKENFSGANAIYTNFINDDIDLIRKAKEMGLEIIHEVIITPNSGLIMLEEYNLYPNIETNNHTLEKVKKGTPALIVVKLVEFCLQSPSLLRKILAALNLKKKVLRLAPMVLMSFI